MSRVLSWSALGIVAAVLVGATVILTLNRRGADPVNEAVEAYARRDWTSAASRAREALKSNPSDEAALRMLARASARQGRDQTAEGIYRRLGTGTMQAEDFFLLGRGLLARDQSGPGRAAIGAALDADRNHPEALVESIGLSIQKQALVQAANEAETLMKQPGWEVAGMVKLARVRHLLLDDASAAELMAAGLERDPELTRIGDDPREARRFLAACQIASGRVQPALQSLQALLNSGPDQESSWLLSRALLTSGAQAEAVTALKAAGGPQLNGPGRVEPATFFGAESCRSCHAREYQDQQQSHHAQTILQGQSLRDLPWPTSPIADTDHGEVIHTIRTESDRLEAEVKVSDQSFRAVIAYALGSNHQGRTFVGRDLDGQARELRLSQYPSAPRWSRTSEHPAQPPDPEGFLGRPISEDSLRRCLHCHSTNFRAVQAPEGRPEARDHGIGCERCHGPGGHHLQAVATGFPDLAIYRPRLASASQVMDLCAECHRAPDSASPGGQGFIRFQAPTLARSRCYTESGTLSCVTCHNPHRDASRTATDYEAVCLSCHPSAGRASTQAQSPLKWPPCPTRAVRGCLDCHMPRVPEAVPRAVFTDHYIRVRKPVED